MELKCFWFKMFFKSEDIDNMIKFSNNFKSQNSFKMFLNNKYLQNEFLETYLIFICIHI